MIPGIGLGNVMELLKNTGKLRTEIEGLKNLQFEGSAGAGMVRVVVSGQLEVVDCKIDSQVFNEHDCEMLEDLVVAATNQALKKIVEAWVERVGNAMGGLNLAGLGGMLKPPTSGPQSS